MTEINYESLAHAGIQKLSPYQTGGFVPQKGISDNEPQIIKLSSNENPLGTSPKVTRVIKENINHLSVYPDGNGTQLKAALSETYDINTNQITLGAGSENIIQMLVQAFNRPQSEILIPEFSFIAYKINANAMNAPFKEVKSPGFNIDIEALIETCSEQTSLIFIANPNNPTGNYLNEKQLTHLLDNVPSTTLVVIDEAYYEFAMLINDYPDTLKLQKRYQNLVILRTFSKAYGLAGLRIGYSISNPKIADILNRIRLPFNTTQLAQDAATEALADSDFIKKTIINNQQQLMALIVTLQELNITFIPSVANFLTVEFGEHTQAFLDYAAQHHIMLRPLAPYKMPSHIRISIGNKQQNEQLIKLIRTFYKELS